MRYSAEHKAESHRKIVEAAAELFRERGLDGVTVGEVMDKAGLTHGGFYAHFASKQALIADAIRSKTGTNASKLATVAERAEPGKALEEMVRGYLSPAHRTRRGKGCIIAALSGEAGRASPEARKALAERSRGMAKTLQPYLTTRPGELGGETARAVSACMIGGVILARLEDDPAEADRLLAACQRFILDALAAPSAGTPSS
jgi:TetR/AcrR family transcriptional repressor of nem operon